MRLLITEPAENDLKDIIDYISLDDPAAAGKVYRAIVAGATRLIDFPHLGHAGRLPQTREYSVTSLPYVIIYRADADFVMILAVFHAARNFARTFAEREDR